MTQKTSPSVLGFLIICGSAWGLAMVFKLFDSLLLGLPIKHGAVANPMFAFLIEGLALLVIVPFLAGAWKRKAAGQAFLGGTSALLRPA